MIALCNLFYILARNAHENGNVLITKIMVTFHVFVIKTDAHLLGSNINFYNNFAATKKQNSIMHLKPGGHSLNFCTGVCDHPLFKGALVTKLVPFYGFLGFVPVSARVSQCRPSRDIPFLGEYPPWPTYQELKL